MNLTVRVAILIACLISFVYPGLAQTPPPDFLLDHNRDGVIDSKDLLILIRKWGLEGIATPTPTSTPTFTSAPIFTNTPILPPTETFTAMSSPSSTETSTSTSTHTATSTDTPTFTPTETASETPTPEPTETPTSPSSITVNVAPMRFVRIPAGSYQMGSSEGERSRGTDESPLHQVTIGYDFYLGETEVTQLQWAAVMGSNPAQDFIPAADQGEGNDYPVYYVSWDDCQAFLAALNALGEGTFRLPSEAEWEYACRARTTTRFYFGNSLGCADECVDCGVGDTRGKGLWLESPGFSRDFGPNLPLPTDFDRSDFMWYCGNSEQSTHPVRQLFPNAFGLYDMSGNVMEWCQDLDHDDYFGAPSDGSAWESGEGIERVVRGGSTGNFARSCRSAYRHSGINPSDREDFIGLRLVRNP